MRLSTLGDYEEADRSSSINRARYLFLKAVDKCVPEIRHDLITGATGQLFASLPGEISMSLTWTSLASSKRNLPLTRTLIAWAKRWHLEEGWCIAQALQVLQLYNWPQAEEEEIEVGWSNPVSLATITTAEEGHFRFEHRGGDLAIQALKEIEEAIRSAFDNALKSYLNRMKRLAEERGYRPVIRKANLTHFEMLARYHVQGWTHAKIAKRYRYADVNTVNHIIPQTAKLIGLTLKERRGKRGPDTKSRTRRSPRSI